jgi:hypothetical protein
MGCLIKAGLSRGEGEDASHLRLADRWVTITDAVAPRLSVRHPA